jgi:hypothetical protein
MRFTLIEGKVSTKEEALADTGARGWHALEIDFPAEDEGLHWHDFETVAFIVDGIARAEFDDGSIEEAGPGSWVEASSRVVHRGVSSVYTAVLGFSVDPAEVTQPINKPVADLA